MIVFASFFHTVLLSTKCRIFPIAYASLVIVFQYTYSDGLEYWRSWNCPFGLATVYMILRCLCKYHHVQYKLRNLFDDYCTPEYFDEPSYQDWFKIIKHTTDVIHSIDHNDILMDSLKHEITQLYGVFSQLDSQHHAQWTIGHCSNIYWDVEFQYMTSTMDRWKRTATPSGLRLPPSS
jgi:hypothetical protein